jgi:hypothetical protein
MNTIADFVRMLETLNESGAAKLTSTNGPLSTNYVMELVDISGLMNNHTIKFSVGSGCIIEYIDGVKFDKYPVTHLEKNSITEKMLTGIWKQFYGDKPIPQKTYNPPRILSLTKDEFESLRPL